MSRGRLARAADQRADHFVIAITFDAPFGSLTLLRVVERGDEQRRINDDAPFLTSRGRTTGPADSGAGSAADASLSCGCGVRCLSIATARRTASFASPAPTHFGAPEAPKHQSEAPRRPAAHLLCLGRTQTWLLMSSRYKRVRRLGWSITRGKRLSIVHIACCLR